MTIHTLSIERFKTINQAIFPLKNLNLFTGMNGMGKSSCLQALLLLKQSFLSGTLPSKGLLLRGQFVNCGHGVDALHQFATQESDTLTFAIQNSKGEKSWSFDAGAENEESELLPLVDANNEGDAVYTDAPFAGRMQYLCADRIAPATSYEASHLEVHEKEQIGLRGEYAVHFLAENQNQPLAIEGMRHESLKESQIDLLNNVRAWLGEISPGVSLSARRDSSIDKAVLTYEYDVGSRHRFTSPLRPTNVGFGVTHSLPLIVSVLSSRPGDLLLIENPESHIHPRGQAQMGILLAMAASFGVQLMIETHSDHILNGVRVAVRRKLLSASETAIFYFDRPRSDSTHSAVIVSPQIDEAGKIDMWPDGFFDDYEKLLCELL